MTTLEIVETDNPTDIPHLPAGCLGVETFVEGDPASQGSKNIGVSKKTGKVHTYESSVKLKPWRQRVTTALRGLPVDVRSQWPYRDAVTLGLDIVRPRNKTAPKTYTPACSTQPDVDKLARAIGDGIGDAKVYANDGQTTTMYVHKRFAERGEVPGCRIVLIPAGRAFTLAINPDVLPRIAVG